MQYVFLFTIKSISSMTINFYLLNIPKFFTSPEIWILLAVVIYAITFRRLSFTAKIIGVLGIVGLLLLPFLLIKKQSAPQSINNSPAVEPVKDANTNQKVEQSQTICSICGNRFSGNGYEEASNGVWRPCDSHTFSMICSESCGLKHTAKMNGIINSLPNKSDNGEDYFSRERARMKRQGYTEGEINQMRDPNLGDPEIKESAKRVFDAIKRQSNNQ